MTSDKKQRILAIDFGTARIGLAISDPLKTVVTALPNLAGSSNIPFCVESLLKHIEDLKKEKGYNIEEIVIGLPILLNGKDSEGTQRVRDFAKLLSEKTSIIVTLFDERLTSVQAERSLIEANLRRKRRAALVDQVSAVILLQTYLEMKSFTR